MATLTRAKKIERYVLASMDRPHKANNISISLPLLNPAELNYLQTKFSRVEPTGMFGYVTFERKAALALAEDK